jgi:IgA Peptidase M64
VSAQPVVAGVVPVVDNGPFVSRFGIVALSEGFTADELDVFRSAVDDLVVHLQRTEPFAANWDCLSLTRIETVSGASGLAPPGQAQGSVFAAEAGTAPRTLRLDWGLVEDLTSDHEPDWQSLLVLVNDTADRGCCLRHIAVTTLKAGWLAVAVHELGHAGFGLGDEYAYSGGSRYAAVEPGAPNVTTSTDRNGLSWAHLVDANTPLPTQRNPNCRRPDTSLSQYPVGTVGTFEGARGFCCGIHRGEYDCLMRSLECDGFCAPCVEAIALRLSTYAP